jgi:hypothetical protein
MHATIQSSGSDMLLIAIPFLVLLVVGFFRLDEIIAAPKKALRQRQPFSGMNEDGKLILSDPDGRRSGKPHPRR